MDTSIFYKDIFTSPSSDNQYNNFFNLESSYLSENIKLDQTFYPITPEKSPLMNELLSMSNYQEQTFLNPMMMMISPLYPQEFFVPESIEKSTFDIDFVDKFIAEHEAALSVPEKINKQNQDMCWSHWTFDSKQSAQSDILSEGLSTSSSTTFLTQSSIQSQSDLNIIESVKVDSSKLIKPRRGRGKGVKNKVKKIEGLTIKKKSIIEGALYVCQHDQCGRSFTRPYNLTSHMRTHTTERPYACSSCGRRFARQHDRNRHEKLHWGIRPYACHHCHKSFARMDALNRHLRMENGCTGIHL